MEKNEYERELSLALEECKRLFGSENNETIEEALAIRDYVISKTNLTLPEEELSAVQSAWKKIYKAVEINIEKIRNKQTQAQPIVHQDSKPINTNLIRNIYCPYCSVQTTGGQRFCGSCGASLEQLQNFMQTTPQVIQPSQPNPVAYGTRMAHNAISNESNADTTGNMFKKPPISRLPRIDLPMNWFRFYVYFANPFGMLIGLIILFQYDSGFLAFISFLLIILQGIIIWGLHIRKIWAWKVNFILLALFSVEKGFNVMDRAVDYDISKGSVIMIAIIIGLTWAILNSVYFIKRKHLFV